MKKLLIAGVLASFLMSVSADVVLTGFEEWNAASTTRAATTNLTGITGTVDMTTGGFTPAPATQQDGDETFGTFAGAAGATGSYGGSAKVLTSYGTDDDTFLDITVENNTGDTYDLTGFHFDAWRKDSGTSGATWTLDVLSGSITAGTVSSGVLAHHSGSIPTASSDFEDRDIDLSGLADFTLADGESAVFRLSFSAGNANLFVDNVAVTAIPEPTTLGLFVVSSSVLLLRRHGRCKSSRADL